MLENTGDSTKRQHSSRNRSMNKHHPRDRPDRIGPFPSDNGEKDGSVSNNNKKTTFDRGGLSGTNYSGNNNTESMISGFVPLHGCSNSEVVKMMRDRWESAVHSCRDQSLDATERAFIYSSSGTSGWGSSKLPHQSFVTDFLAAMGQAVHRANINQVNPSTHPK